MIVKISNEENDAEGDRSMRVREYRGAILMVAVTLTGLGAVASVPDSDVGLDAYRSWKALTPEARLVPFELAIRCAPVTAEQLDTVRKSHGPHTARWIRVYANPLAATALQDERSRVFPVGAVIAKEKLRAPDDARADGVAFMIKRPKGQFVESDGWEFLYRPAGPEKASYDGCIACHRAGATKDYVFSRDGRQSVLR
jgi:hypothetical protein